MAYKNGSSILADYAYLRTLPALTVALLFVFSAYLYGAISPLTLEWGIDYTITTQGALIGSLVIYALAFASSETKDLEKYEKPEIALISSGPGIMLLYQYIPYVQDQFAAYDPTLSIIAFIFSMVSWGVMVR